LERAEAAEAVIIAIAHGRLSGMRWSAIHYTTAAAATGRLASLSVVSQEHLQAGYGNRRTSRIRSDVLRIGASANSAQYRFDAPGLAELAEKE